MYLIRYIFYHAETRKYIAEHQLIINSFSSLGRQVHVHPSKGPVIVTDPMRNGEVVGD
jgi:hypothetical protein